MPIAHASTDRAHGRIEKRSVKVVTVSVGILFPHARQAIQIIRKTRHPDSTKWTTEIAYAVTSLTAEQATAREVGSPPLDGPWTAYRASRTGLSGSQPAAPVSGQLVVTTHIGGGVRESPATAEWLAS